jgi:hypothetical protein
MRALRLLEGALKIEKKLGLSVEVKPPSIKASMGFSCSTKARIKASIIGEVLRPCFVKR